MKVGDAILEKQVDLMEKSLISRFWLPSLMGLTMVLSPIYLWSLGGGQPVDIPIVIIQMGILATLTMGEVRKIAPVVLPLCCFVLWVFGRNVSSFVLEPDIEYVLSSLRILYNGLILCVFGIAFNRVLKAVRNWDWLLLCIVMMVLVPVLFYENLQRWLVGGEGLFVWRWALSFNSPIQLAYFSVIVYSLLLLVLSAKEKLERGHAHQTKLSWWYILAYVTIISMVHVLVVLSASKAGIVSIVAADFILIWLYRGKWLIPVGGLALIVGLTVFQTPIGFLLEDTTLKQRFEGVDLVANLKSRTIVLLPEVDEVGLVFGHGVTSRDLVKSNTQEIHNSLLYIAYNYGMVGLGSFLCFGFIWFRTVNREIPAMLLILLPVFLFNMAHFGLRFRLLWIFLGCALGMAYTVQSLKASAN